MSSLLQPENVLFTTAIVVMLGIGVASAEGAHLRPRFADGWLPRSWDPALLRLQECLMAIFCIAFAAVALGVVMESYELQERSSVLRTLVWPVQTIMPVVFLFAAIRHGLFAIYPALRPQGSGSGLPGPS